MCLSPRALDEILTSGPRNVWYMAQTGLNLWRQLPLLCLWDVFRNFGFLVSADSSDTETKKKSPLPDTPALESKGRRTQTQWVLVVQTWGVCSSPSLKLQQRITPFCPASSWTRWRLSSLEAHTCVDYLQSQLLNVKVTYVMAFTIFS